MFDEFAHSDHTSLQAVLNDLDQAIADIPADTNTWIANSVSQAGYVPAGEGNGNSFYATDSTGVPAWRDISPSLIGLPHVQDINVQESFTMNNNQTLSLETIAARDNDGIQFKDNDNNVRFSISDSGTLSANNASGLQALNASYISSGTLSDARLSSTVTNLGDSIESSEITSLDASKLTGDIADARLSDTVTKLGNTIESSEITSLDGSKLTGTVNNARLDSDLQDLADGTLSGSKVGSGIDGSTITTGTIDNARLDVGSLSTQDADSVAITGGTVDVSRIQTTDLTVTNLTVENGEQSLETNQLFPVKSFGYVNSNRELETGAYNASVSIDGEYVVITFDTPMQNANYTVMVTSDENPKSNILPNTSKELNGYQDLENWVGDSHDIDFKITEKTNSGFKIKNKIYNSTTKTLRHSNPAYWSYSHNYVTMGFNFMILSI